MGGLGSERQSHERNAPCIVIHDDCHAVHAQSVRLGHHALTEAVRDVVRTKEPDEDNNNVGGNERKGGNIPPLKHHPLKIQIGFLAARQDAPRIARLADRSLDKRIEVSTAAQPILYAQTADGAQPFRPLRVNLPLEVKRPALVGNVTGCDEKGKDYPEQECVYCEKGTVV